MNVQDIANRVRRTFGDDASIQVEDDDIIRWVNDAQLQISIDNEDLLETTASSTIVSGQADYTAPSNMNVLRSLMYDNTRVRQLSFNEFNEYLDGFKAPANVNVYGQGRPEVFMLYGGTITLFPTPNTGIVDGLRIYYSRHPASVTTLADALEVPERYHKAIVESCLQNAYEMDENPEMMSIKRGQFDATVQKLKHQEKSTDEYYPRLTTLPEDSAFYEGIW